MPRYYKPFKPSANKAIVPVTETKAPQEKAEKPPKKQKAETDGQ